MVVDDRDCRACSAIFIDSSRVDNTMLDLAIEKGKRGTRVRINLFAPLYTITVLNFPAEGISRRFETRCVHESSLIVE